MKKTNHNQNNYLRRNSRCDIRGSLRLFRSRGIFFRVGLGLVTASCHISLILFAVFRTRSKRGVENVEMAKTCR